MFHRKGIESLSGELIEIHDGRVRLAYTTVRGFAALYNWGKLAKISTMSQETCINAWGLLRSGVPAIIHYSASNACSQSRAQRLPLKGSSEGQSYPECWLESVPRNYANFERCHHFPQEPQNFPALFGSGVDSNYPVLYQYPKGLSESG